MLMKIKALPILLQFIFGLFCFSSVSQNTYVINGNTVFLYQEKEVSSEIICIVPNGTNVLVNNKETADWWQVTFRGNTGYIDSKLLVPLEKFEEYKGWEKSNSITGDNPNCENITEEFNDSINNELLIRVGLNADVVVKLMKFSGECNRIVYIKSGDSYAMKNIPEEVYFLKLAYGKDLRKFVSDGKCKVKFMVDPLYKTGTNKLDFAIVKKPNTIIDGKEYRNWEIPSYELFLDVDYKKMDANNFRSSTISEEEFNK